MPNRERPRCARGLPAVRRITPPSGSTEGPRVRARFASLTADPIRTAIRLALIGLLSYAPARAADDATLADNIYRNGFDEPNASWVMTPHAGAPTKVQRRTSDGRHSGDAAELFMLMAEQPDPKLEI